MPPRQLFDIRWPVKGLVENAAYVENPEGSTLECLNVRPFDQFERRLRGGQRAGIKKYLDSQLGGGTAIQGLESLSVAFDPDALLVDTVILDQDYDSVVSSKTHIEDFDSRWTARSWSNFSSLPLAPPGSGKGLSLYSDHGLRSTQGVFGSGIDDALFEDTALGDTYILTMGFVSTDTSFQGIYGVIFRAPSNPTTFGYYRLIVQAANDIVLQSITSSGITTLETYSPSMSLNTGYTLAAEINGSTLTVKLDGATVGTTTLSLHAGNRRVGLQCQSGAESRGYITSFKIASAKSNTSSFSRQLVAVAAGDIYVGTKAEGLSTPSGGASAVRGTGPVGAQSAFQKVFFADGVSGNYVYYDKSANAVNDWETDVTAGTLPKGSTDSSIGCTIIALYRGRIVLSGLREEPQNWFMSRSGDPFDWDYSPSTTTALDPVAGNNSEVGELGDPVTALAPFQDDVMIMGSPNSLWIMRGDPAAGGAIDNISRQIGIVQSTAWTWDSTGSLYFFGQDGLYRLAPESGLPQPISRGRLDRTFGDIDFSENYVFLVYDPQWKGVHIFISPASEPDSASSHYFWDERTDSFWRDEYPTNTGPTATLLYEANSPSDRAVVMGGYDGYLRAFSDTAKDDDGTAITSRCWMAPVTPGGIYASARYDDIQMVLAKDSDAVTAKLYTGASPEDAAANIDAGNNPRAVRSLIGGRNQPMRRRISQNTLIPVLEQTGMGSWAFEQGGGVYQILDRMRYRRVT